MATKTPQAAQADQPAQEPQQTTQDAPQAAQEPKADPGPPPAQPALPAALSGHSLSARLHALAAAGEREALQAVSLIHEPPAVHHFRAELVSWLEALAHYHATK